MKTYVSLSPNEHEVKMGIKHIISLFEGTIGIYITIDIPVLKTNSE